ncbi:MAG: haloacid dehalogenase type II [Thiolinea sp.]
MTTPQTLAFDVYGTLIDTHGVVTALQSMVGTQAPAFSQTWRDKQLEYSFRRGLMQRYQTFAVVTRQALDYTCQHYGLDLSAAQRDELMALYRVLPAFADAEPALQALKAAGHRLYAFSNGTAAAVEQLLVHAGIRDYFLGVVSVDDLQTFKPNPAVYQHFLQQATARAEDSWLISGNPFDVLGALNSGMHAAWIRRSPAVVFDPWEQAPDRVLGGLGELLPALEQPE